MTSITGEGRGAKTVSRATVSAPFGRRLSKSMLPSSWLVCALAAVGTCTLAAASVAILLPNVRPVLLQEDGIIEMASVACLVAVVLGAGSASVAWGLRLPLLAGGLIGLAELLDEASFGARIFGFQPPALYGGGELDGFHDLLILAYRLLRDVNGSLAWLWVGLILASSLGIVLFALSQAGKGIRNKRSAVADHALLFLHIGFIGLAQVIDIATSSNALSAVEETLEFNASLVLAFYITQQAHHSWTESTASLPV